MRGDDRLNVDAFARDRGWKNIRLITLIFNILAFWLRARFREAY